MTPPIYRCRWSCRCTLIILGSVIGCSTPNESVLADLTKVVTLDGHRSVQPFPGNIDELQWRMVPRADTLADEMLPAPLDLCWVGNELVVADQFLDHVAILSVEGNVLRVVGGTGDGPAEFRRIETLACPPSAGFFLVADMERRLVSFLSAEGNFLRGVRAPETPQGIPYLGTFAVFDDTIWVDSWLGSDVGPFLDLRTWDTLSTMRAWDPNGENLGGFGRVSSTYSTPASTRAFNQLAMRATGEKLWVLTHAEAVLRAYEGIPGTPAARELVLPVHHRGMDPVVELGDPLPNGYRRNRVIYERNVGDFDIVYDSLFAVVRYTNYALIERETPSGSYLDLWPQSSIDVVDLNGSVVRRFAAPGRVLAIATNREGWIAILSEDRDTAARRVWSTHLGPV